jgi:hypothetical protein
LRQEDLRQWRLIDTFRRQLAQVVPTAPDDSTWTDPARKFALADYLSLFLFALVNPVLATTRALCAASKLSRVQRELCERPVSLGSFSEAQHLTDPAWLERLFTRLAAQVTGPTPRDPHSAWQQWVAATVLLPALPACTGRFGGGKAKKSGAPTVPCAHCLSPPDDKPAAAHITDGKTRERKPSPRERAPTGDR